jgi:hypothetical protein
MVASCRKREKVSGMIVGLYVVGSWTSALIMARRRVSPCAAPRALCLSGSPFAFFLRLHLRVVLIFHVRLLALFSVYPSTALRWIGTSVPISSMSVWISFCMAVMNCSRSEARSASMVSISSVSPL